MRVLNRLFRRLLNITARRRDDERLRGELASHTAARTEGNIRRPFAAAEAIRNDDHAKERLPFFENRARQTQVMSAAVGRPIVLLAVGSAVGLLSGVFASRLLGQIVYQANPRDPVVVGGAVLTMALLGIAASAIPAWRALAVDPSKLMREE
jgi:hypothetical protein